MSDTQTLTRIEAKIDAHMREYQLDMHGDHDQPGLKTSFALTQQRVDKHSKDIEANKDERRKWFWTVVSLGAGLIAVTVAFALPKVFELKNNTQEKR